jgi:hypothetical protein
MTDEDKYADIVNMKPDDSREIHELAMRRSNELQAAPLQDDGDWHKLDGVIDIEDFKSHITVNGGNDFGVHVVPVSMIQNIIDGKIRFSGIDRGDDLRSAILIEWLSMME